MNALHCIYVVFLYFLPIPCLFHVLRSRKMQNDHQPPPVWPSSMEFCSQNILIILIVVLRPRQSYILHLSYKLWHNVRSMLATAGELPGHMWQHHYTSSLPFT